MMDVDTTSIQRLNGCKYLFLESFRSDQDPMDLVVQVAEARAQKKEIPISTGSSSLDEIMGAGRPIVVNDGCSRFRVTFENYISFLITNETYDLPEEQEDYSRMLRTYSRSSFLDHVAKATWATQENPGPFVHYALVCMDHVIDVICQKHPRIEVL